MNKYFVTRFPHYEEEETLLFLCIPHLLYSKKPTHIEVGLMFCRAAHNKHFWEINLPRVITLIID
jgi:hypothetical protein